MKRAELRKVIVALKNAKADAEAAAKKCGHTGRDVDVFMCGWLGSFCTSTAVSLANAIGDEGFAKTIELERDVATRARRHDDGRAPTREEWNASRSVSDHSFNIVQQSRTKPIGQATLAGVGFPERNRDAERAAPTYRMDLAATGAAIMRELQAEFPGARLSWFIDTEDAGAVYDGEKPIARLAHKGGAR